MLLTDTPIGKIQIPEWQEKEVIAHSDEELLQRAIIQNKKFCISPAVFSEIERRNLGRRLQHLILRVETKIIFNTNMPYNEHLNKTNKPLKNS